MENSKITMLESHIIDSEKDIAISNMKVSDYLIAEANELEFGWEWFLSEEELATLSNDTNYKEIVVKEISDYLEANFNYKFLTADNYKEVEDCFVNDDNGTVVYVSKRSHNFIVNSDNYDSNEWVEFDNATTIFCNKSGGVYVSGLTLREELGNYIEECENGCSYRIWNEDIAYEVITYINSNLEQIIRKDVDNNCEDWVNNVCSYIDSSDALEYALGNAGKCYYSISFGLWANADDCKEADKKAYLESKKIKANCLALQTQASL